MRVRISRTTDALVWDYSRVRMLSVFPNAEPAQPDGSIAQPEVVLHFHISELRPQENIRLKNVHCISISEKED